MCFDIPWHSLGAKHRTQYIQNSSLLWTLDCKGDKIDCSDCVIVFSCVYEYVHSPSDKGLTGGYRTLQDLP